MSGAVGSIPSLTRSCRPPSSCSWRRPSGSASTAPSSRRRACVVAAESVTVPMLDWRAGAAGSVSRAPPWVIVDTGGPSAAFPRRRAASPRWPPPERDRYMLPRLIRPRRRSRNREASSPRPSRDGRPGLASVNGGGSDGGQPPREPSPTLPGSPDPPPPRRRPKLKKLRFALVFLGLAMLAFVSWIFGIMMAVASDLPQPENRAQFEHAQNSVLYDVNHRRIATLTNNQGRILIGSADIAPVMKEATVAIEDQRFYEHRGIDYQGIARAVFQDVLHRGATQGASTITQQFVKNALRAQGSRTVFEKLREAALAYQLERHWDKDKILTEYLNEIYFGQGAYGIEAAAKTYFGWDHPGCGAPHDRCASQLFPWEAAMLAGLIANPSGYDPKTNPGAALARRNAVLQNMADQGYITQQEYRQYSRQPLPRPGEIHAPIHQSKAP